ncbi:MAG: hypothetical protein F2635_01400 [Actinobacteria bacterium]|nr:hypothetical protein [Actinomycetota bacterium]
MYFSGRYYSASTYLVAVEITRLIAVYSSHLSSSYRCLGFLLLLSSLILMVQASPVELKS